MMTTITVVVMKRTMMMKITAQRQQFVFHQLQLCHQFK